MDDLGKAHPEWDDYPSTIGLLRYANAHLTKKDVEFFNSLPITMTIKNEGMPDIVICHGSPRKVNEPLPSPPKFSDRIPPKPTAHPIILRSVSLSLLKKAQARSTSTNTLREFKMAALLP